MLVGVPVRVDMRATRPGAGGRTSLPEGIGGTGFSKDIESACRREIWEA